MDITAHIRELLFGHDCVIVPGFGGFIGNYTPARIDKSTSTFYPPVKQISFNRNLNHNDGLLIGKISGSTGLNYGDSRAVVEQFAEDLSRRLSKGEKITFSHIGSFMLNHEGNIQFEPDQEANYHLNSYGLGSFRFMPLEGYDVRKRILRRSEDEPVRHSSMRKYLWRAAVIIPLLGVLITVPLTTNIFKTKSESSSLNPLASVELKSNDSAVISQAVTSGPADSSSMTIKESVPETPEPAGSYHIITGSFQSEANARELMKRLSAEGYEPELLDGPNGFFRVSAQRCSTLDEAIQKKDSISGSYSGTWVARIR